MNKEYLKRIVTFLKEAKDEGILTHEEWLKYKRMETGFAEVIARVVNTRSKKEQIND